MAKDLTSFRISVTKECTKDINVFTKTTVNGTYEV